MSYDPTFTDALIFGLRTCSKCGRDYPACRTYFKPSYRDPAGIGCVCKTCRGEREAERYATEPEYREGKKAAFRRRYAERKGTS
jgi:hypothetical protein